MPSKQALGLYVPPRVPVFLWGATIGCMLSLLSLTPDRPSPHNGCVLVGLAVGPVLASHLISNPSFNDWEVESGVSRISRSFFSQSFDTKTDDAAAASNTLGSARSKAKKARVRSQGLKESKGGPLSIAVMMASLLCALYIVMAINVIPHPRCNIGDAFSFSTSSYLLYLSGITSFEAACRNQRDENSLYIISSVVQLLSGICLSALMSSTVIYTIETRLSSERGSAVCSLFTCIFLSAQVSSLLMKAYRIAVLSLFGSSAATGLATKIAVSVAYWLVFIIFPLGLCIALVIRCMDLAESPRWILAHRSPRACSLGLQQLRGTDETTMEFNVLYRYLAIDARRGYSYLDILKPLWESDDNNPIIVDGPSGDSGREAGKSKSRNRNYGATGGGGDLEESGELTSGLLAGSARGGSLSPIFVVTCLLFIVVPMLLAPLSMRSISASMRELALSLSSDVNPFIILGISKTSFTAVLAFEILAILATASGCLLNYCFIDGALGRRGLLLVAAMVTFMCCAALFLEVEVSESNGIDLLQAGWRATLLICLGLFAIPNLHFCMSPLLLYISEASPYRLRGKFVSLYFSSYFIFVLRVQSDNSDVGNSNTTNSGALKREDLGLIAVSAAFLALFVFVLVPETQKLMLEDIDRELFNAYSYCGYLSGLGRSDFDWDWDHDGGASLAELSFFCFPCIAVERRFTGRISNHTYNLSPNPSTFPVANQKEDEKSALIPGTDVGERVISTRIRLFGMKRVPKKDLLVNIIARSSNQMQVSTPPLYIIDRIYRGDMRSAAYHRRFKLKIDQHVLKFLQQEQLSFYPISTGEVSVEASTPELHQLFCRSVNSSSSTCGPSNRNAFGTICYQPHKRCGNMENSQHHPDLQRGQESPDLHLENNDKNNKIKNIFSSKGGGGGLVQPGKVHRYSASMARQSWKYMDLSNNQEDDDEGSAIAVKPFNSNPSPTATLDTSRWNTSSV